MTLKNYIFQEGTLVQKLVLNPAKPVEKKSIFPEQALNPPPIPEQTAVRMSLHQEEIVEKLLIKDGTVVPKLAHQLRKGNPFPPVPVLTATLKWNKV